MQGSNRKPYLFYSVLTGAIACLSAFLVSKGANTSLCVSALVGINAAALAGMGLDKSFARSNSPRIPEVLLFIIALLGGAPGILSGIYIFKHKTRKAAFQFTLLTVVALQVALVRVLGIAVCYVKPLAPLRAVLLVEGAEAASLSAPLDGIPICRQSGVRALERTAQELSQQHRSMK